jgi:hypothetical protein
MRLLGGGYDLITTQNVGAQLHNTINSPFNCLPRPSFLRSCSCILLPLQEDKWGDQNSFMQQYKFHPNAFQQDKQKQKYLAYESSKNAKFPRQPIRYRLQ